MQLLQHNSGKNV